MIPLGVLAGLLVLAGVAVVFLVDVNAHKPRIEAAVSDALGMEFRIRGNAGLRLFPSAGIALSEIRLRNRGAEIAAAETLSTVEQAKRLMGRSECVPFYAGSVPHPR